MASMITNLMPTMSTSFSSPSPSPSSTGSPSLTKLPVKSIPGSYGLPVLGPIADRLDYFWFQGPQTFLKKRMEKYNSTVFRTNVPPTFPFYLNVNPQMIAVLDCMAFTSLFDMEVVEKKNILIGDFMPSLSFTGDIRVGVYLDPTEPQHAQVKDYSMDILKRSSKVWTAEFQSNIDHMWSTLESNLSSSANGEASYIEPLQKCLFRFLTKSIIGADPQSSPEIGEKGHIFLDLWLALQILPTQKIGILQPLEEIFLHSFAYPSWLVKGGYNKLCEFVKTKGDETVQRGVTEFGLTQDEAIHNLLFILGFNAFGGFSVFLPSVLTTLGDKKNGGIRDRLRKEVREIAGSTRLSFDSVAKMELVKSFVYETLRLNPPVSSQFARARKDFVLNSHASAFQVKKGELLFGYQPMAMRDPKVFEDPETFVPDRFAKNKGLLDYLFWSNGPETGSPSSSNKQCAGKDYVVLTACMFVADLFQRFDSIQVSSTSITAIEKAK